MEKFEKQKTIPFLPHEEPSAPIEIPAKIGPYKIDSLLDKGGMSILYLSTHPETHAPIVIKVLEPKFLSRPDVVQRFIQETQIIGLPSHPNIVKLYSHGEWEGGLYIAMEFIQGISLRQFLLKSHISLKRALEIVTDISYALCHLHTHGIIHRDLKPENVLITNEGKIKVIDFGIAQLLTEQPDPQAPAKQHIIGTPVYMSPEQRENPDLVSYPSDIYALGIITYELVIGKLSYGQIHLGLVPKSLKPILQKSLQHKPADRYQDIVDFITDITLYLESDAFTSEAKPSDQISDMSEGLERAEAALQPEPPADWTPLAIETLTAKGSFTYFHRYAEHLYGIVLGKCKTKEAEGIFLSAVMSGMVKMLTKLEQNPVDWLTKLNTLMIEERIKYPFLFNYLVIDLEKGECRFTCTPESALWIRKPDQLEKLPLANPPLGEDPNAVFQMVSHTWNTSDPLVITSGEPEETASLLPQIFKNWEGERKSPFTIISIKQE